jgi:hypothetical protein
MKDLIKSWKFWLIVAAVVLVLVGTILFFTVPEFKNAIIAIFAALAGAALCFGIGYYFGNKNKEQK